MLTCCVWKLSITGITWQRVAGHYAITRWVIHGVTLHQPTQFHSHGIGFMLRVNETSIYIHVHTKATTHMSQLNIHNLRWRDGPRSVFPFTPISFIKIQARQEKNVGCIIRKGSLCLPKLSKDEMDCTWLSTLSSEQNTDNSFNHLSCFQI